MTVGFKVEVALNEGSAVNPFMFAEVGKRDQKKASLWTVYYDRR